MEPKTAVEKIQYTWRVHRVRNVLDEAFRAEIEKRAVERLRTLQRTFRIKLRKRFLEVLVSEAMRRIERVQERKELDALVAGDSVIT
jgi:hypothetical protein